MTLKNKFSRRRVVAALAATGVASLAAPLTTAAQTEHLHCDAAGYKSRQDLQEMQF